MRTKLDEGNIVNVTRTTITSTWIQANEHLDGCKVILFKLSIISCNVTLFKALHLPSIEMDLDHLSKMQINNILTQSEQQNYK